MNKSFLTGPEVLARYRRVRLRGLRVGLLSHQAAVCSDGEGVADLFRTLAGVRLAALFGPEHGFFGIAGAGEGIARARHPLWGIPVYSLYGAVRRPTSRMLKGLDVLIIALRDMAARPYTYVSTLRLVLESAAEVGLPVIVADVAPPPLPWTVDGPMPDAGFENFICFIPAPMAYGMTQAETALWLQWKLNLDLNLDVAPMSGWTRRDAPERWALPPWIPPSPGIRTLESGRCYLASVFAEALPAIDYGVSAGLPFQVVGAEGLDVGRVKRELDGLGLPGVCFHPHFYRRPGGRYCRGLRICVVKPRVFLPVLTGTAILWALQRVLGPERLWGRRGTRPDFFDKLYGSDGVRRALQRGAHPTELAAEWRGACAGFLRERRRFLLY